MSEKEVKCCENNQCNCNCDCCTCTCDENGKCVCTTKDGKECNCDCKCEEGKCTCECTKETVDSCACKPKATPLNKIDIDSSQISGCCPPNYC